MPAGGGEIVGGGQADPAPEPAKAPLVGKAMGTGHIIGATVLKIPQREGMVR